MNNFILARARRVRAAIASELSAMGPERGGNKGLDSNKNVYRVMAFVVARSATSFLDDYGPLSPSKAKSTTGGKSMAIAAEKLQMELFHANPQLAEVEVRKEKPVFEKHHVMPQREALMRGEPDEPEIKTEDNVNEPEEEKISEPQETGAMAVKVELGELSTHAMVRLDSDGRRRIYEAPNSVTMNNDNECQLIRMDLPPIKVMRKREQL